MHQKVIIVSILHMRKLRVRGAKQNTKNIFVEKGKTDNQKNCIYDSSLLCFPILYFLPQSNNFYLINDRSMLTSLYI